MSGMSAAALAPFPRVLVVTSQPSRREQWLTPPTGPEIRWVDEAGAGQTLEADRFDAVLWDGSGDLEGLALFRQLKASAPRTERVLVARYAQLPELIRLGGAALFDRALPDRPALVRAWLNERLGNAAVPADSGPEPDLPAIDLRLEPLRRSVALFSRSSGAVVRPLSPGPRYLELQLVVEQVAADALQPELDAEWGAALKPRGEKLARAARSHPVVQLLGNVGKDQALYVQPLKRGGWAYLALLPWRAEPRVTAVLGVVGTGELPEERGALLQPLHAFAVSGCSAWVLPRVPPAASGGAPTLWFAREYGWVVTRGYVGPDRRTKPTSLFNRYILSGRRELLPENSQNFSDRFVDRVHPAVIRLAIAYLALSIVDSSLSAFYLRRAGLAELNPVLRGMLGQGQLPFLVAKNALSLSGMFLVVRYQLWRAGRIALLLNVLGYALLDAYWVWLIAKG